RPGRALRCTAKKPVTKTSLTAGWIASRRQDSIASRPLAVIPVTRAPDIVYRLFGYSGLGCGRQEIIRQNLPEGSHGNVDASVLATLHRSYDLQRRHGITSRYRNRRSQGVRSGCDPDRYFRRPDAARHSRSHAKEPRRSAELPHLGTSALSAGRDQAGDAAVLLREREGRHAVQPRYPRGYLSACEDGARQAAVWHPGGCLSRGLRMDAPFGGAEDSYQREISHHHRRSGLHQAVFGIGVQCLGDELWRA